MVQWRQSSVVVMGVSITILGDDCGDSNVAVGIVSIGKEKQMVRHNNGETKAPSSRTCSGPRTAIMVVEIMTIWVVWEAIDLATIEAMWSATA
jgi:hypothetical protein